MNYIDNNFKINKEDYKFKYNSDLPIETEMVFNYALSRFSNTKIDHRYGSCSHMFLTNLNGEEYYFSFLEYLFPISNGSFLEAINNDTTFNVLTHVIKSDEQIRIEKYDLNNQKITLSIYSMKENIDNIGLFLYKISTGDTESFNYLNKECYVLLIKENNVIKLDEDDSIIENQNQIHKYIDEMNNIFQCFSTEEPKLIKKI